MSIAKQVSRRKRRGKTGPVLRAAGLSLSLASGASATTLGSAADMPRGNVTHEIALSEEEILDVSLATFYILDKEGNAGFGSGVRLAFACGGGCGGCGCWTGTYYAPPESHPSPPPHPTKRMHKRLPHRP
jgi:hypothetical protein